jgi:hypothetical protein
MKRTPIILLAFIVLALETHAQSANVNGTWNMVVETGMGNGTPTFVLNHVTDSTFAGSYTGQLGQSSVKGTLKGNKVHIEFEMSGNLIEYNGTMDGDDMKGNVRLGTMAEGTFTGKRKKG